jgi:hypothetical protein
MLAVLRIPRSAQEAAMTPTGSVPITHLGTDVAASRWPAERILFALGGTMTLLSALLVATVSPWFLLLTAFIGVNQWLYVTLGACPASLVLRRFGVRSQCIW